MLFRSLNDEVLRDLHERLTYLRNLEEKKEQVLKSIEEQGKLTEELQAKIVAAETMVVVEDLYRPYRPKRKTRASVAKEKGLDGLAQFILAQETTAPIEEEAAKYVHEDEDAARTVATVADAIQGAKDIIAEMISDEADYRIYIRNITTEEGKLTSVAKDVFYLTFLGMSVCPPHFLLCLYKVRGSPECSFFIIDLTANV